MDEMKLMWGTTATEKISNFLTFKNVRTIL